MIAKTLTGVSFFDARYGGAYRGRALLVTGRAGAGKSILGLQFIAQGVKQGDRCLILSAHPAADLVLYASAFDLPIDQAVDSGSLIVLEYNDYIPGRDREETLTLPPEGFVQLQEIIDSNAIQRVVLDTALPWVTTRSQELLAERVFSFVRAFDRLGCTTMLTLPKPVSPPAVKLKNALEDVIPVSIALAMEYGSEQRSWLVTKYLGEKRLDPSTEYVLAPGVGLQAVSGALPAEPAPAAAVAAPAVGPAPAPGAPVVAPGPDSSPKKVRFSNVVFGEVGAAAPARPPDRSFRWGVTMNR